MDFSNKLVRHMTLSEYKTNVVPLIMELKKILRKNYLKCVDYTGFTFLPYEEYVDYFIKNSLKRNTPYKLGEDYYRGYANELWSKSNLKKDPIPTELYNRYKEIHKQLNSMFGEGAEKYFDISKSHKDHKPEVRRCISSDVYINDIKEGIVDFETLEDVCSSVGVRIPKRVLELKDKYSGTNYQRSELTRMNEEFVKSIRDVLSPFTDEIKKSKRDSLEYQLKDYQKSGKRLYNYTSIGNKRNNLLYQELSNFVKFNNNHEELLTGSEYETKMTNMCNEYTELYIQTFIHRLENKLNLLNSKWGIPKIEFSNTYLRNGQLETNFSLTYKNGKVITGDTKVILAGGYIQVLHSRYLFNFYLNGKKINMEGIDSLS